MTKRVAPIWDRVTCSVCGLNFDQESWDVRHTDPDDELSDIHEECCSQCRVMGIE